MSKELFEALKGMQAQSGIPMEDLIDKIKGGILKAVRRDYPDTENVRIVIDPETEEFSMAVFKTVVEGEPEDPANEITLDVARTYHPDIAIGQDCEITLNPAAFGRVAASSAKQSIRSDIKQFERDKLIALYHGRERELVSATVQKIEPGTGNAILSLDNDEIYFPRQEQIPGESYTPGQIIKVYIVGVVNPEKKPAVKVSRVHREFVRRLFELEVPEIYEGTVEIKAISRDPGSRCKVAVKSVDPAVDAIGACIGPKRSRINAVMSQICGEKIDLVNYSDDEATFIANALAPAETVSVEVNEGIPHTCVVVVPDNQLSLAIGNKGQNAKLAAKLTGFRIDIIPASRFEKEKAEREAAEAEAEAETEADAGTEVEAAGEREGEAAE